MLLTPEIQLRVMKFGGNWSRLALRSVLFLMAVISIVIGIRHAFQYECHDLQWMGARLIGQHIDPWQVELAHNPNHFQHFSPPNYLHPLYLILLPFGLLSFHSAEVLWTGGNICLSILCVLMLRHLFEMNRSQTVFALCLLWMSSPFRVVLEVGQMSFFELFFLTSAYMATSTAVAGLSFGFSLVKYSFSPAAAMLFLLRGRMRFLLFSAAVPLIGLIGVWLLIKTPLLRLAGEPFAVSSSPTAVNPGFADVMTFTEQALQFRVDIHHARQFAYAFGFLGCSAYALLLSRFRMPRSAEFTLISIASLFFFKHLVYDYVFLVVLLCFALSQSNFRVKWALVGGVLIFWFLLPLIERGGALNLEAGLWQLSLNCALQALLLTFTTCVVITAARLPGICEADSQTNR